MLSFKCYDRQRWQYAAGKYIDPVKLCPINKELGQTEFEAEPGHELSEQNR